MNIDKQFDEQFLTIGGLNKNWLPWIGERYVESAADKKLLIVGESNYITPEVDVTQYDYIRNLINKDGMLQGWYETNQFIGERHKKLERMLSINTDDINSKREFWQKVGYYNLIQTPLESRGKNDRPHYQLFLDGWNVFFQIVNIIQPRFCLMNGVESFNHFYEDKAKIHEFTVIKKIKLEMVDKTYPRKIILQNTTNGKLTDMLFIGHTSSSYNNWKNWIDLVSKEINH